MNRIVLISVLAAGLFFSAAGDDFEDFIQDCAKISANYNRGIRVKGTRFDKEYQMYLEHMKMLSHKIQAVIRRLGIGQDIDFPVMVMELEQIYLGSQDQSGVKGSEKLSAHSESPESLLKVLTADVKALRKMEFTTEDGGSIKSSLETKRQLMEFRRLIDFFNQNYAKINKNPQKKDSSLERIFQQRMRRMVALSGNLMQIARRNNPDTQSKINLQTETTDLMQYYEAWCELRKKTVGSKNNKNYRSSKSNKNNKGRKTPKKTKRLDGLNTPAALQAEMRVSLRNINDQLSQWEQSGFKSDGFIVKDGNNRIEDSDPASAMQANDKKSTNYSAMNEKELAALLDKRRKDIIKSNRSMDGFDRDAERQFLLTLSRENKRSYNEFVRNFQQQGYSSEQATRNAILKVQTKIQMEGKPLPVKEMIRMLQALDKDEERRKTRDNTEFKLESSRL